MSGKVSSVKPLKEQIKFLIPKIYSLLQVPPTKSWRNSKSRKFLPRIFWKNLSARTPPHAWLMRPTGLPGLTRTQAWLLSLPTILSRMTQSTLTTFRKGFLSLNSSADYLPSVSIQPARKQDTGISRSRKTSSPNSYPRLKRSPKNRTRNWQKFFWNRVISFGMPGYLSGK